MTMFSSANDAKVGGGGAEVRTTTSPTKSSTTTIKPTVADINLEDGGSGELTATEHLIPFMYRPSKTNVIPKAEDYQQTPAVLPSRCEAGKHLVNVRLRGDLDAGEFTKRGLVTSMTECSRFCCDDSSCDLAYLLEKICFTVSCRNAKLCQAVASSPTSLNPIISYVTRYDGDGNVRKNPHGLEHFVITQSPPSKLPTTSPTTPIQHTEPTTTAQPVTTHTQHRHPSHHETTESVKHHHIHGDEENNKETKHHHHKHADKHHSEKNKHKGNSHHHHEQHQGKEKSSEHSSRHHNHHHGNVHDGEGHHDDGHHEDDQHDDDDDREDDQHDDSHHRDGHHGNGHYGDGHHGHHNSHKTSHKEIKDEEQEKEPKGIDSIISHLSPDDLETITSLNIAGNGATLDEITQCTASDYSCQHYCINLPNGGHRCMCHHGYTLTVNGRHCEALDECYEENHGCEHHCLNNNNNYTCQCNSGFMLNADGKHCDDLDECKLEIHSCSQLCQNTPGSYRCYCKQGYKLDTDMVTCRSFQEMGTRKDLINHDQGLQIPTMIVQSPEDRQAMQHQTAIFQCKARGHPAPHIAWAMGPNGDQPLPSDDRFGLLPNGALVIRSLNISDSGLYRCVASNPAGSAAEGAFLTVDDEDECSTSSHICDQQCVNTIGSYHCRCKSGYLINNDGKACDDIDECNNGSQRCSQVCHNTLGSYTCSCHSGYELQHDKLSCIDIDECSARDHGCSQLCNNTQGSYDCYCLHGFTLAADNVTCIGRTSSVSKNGWKSTTLSAGMAAFLGILIVSFVFIVASIICGIRFMKKRARGNMDDEEKAYKKSIFSWLEEK